MSWDIYGEPLARGHCEVHPWVHESYPCGICMEDGRRAEDARREEEAYWDAQQEAYYAEIQMDEWVADDLGPLALAHSTSEEGGSE